LFAVADAASEAWGGRARAAALELQGKHDDEELRVQLLRDIRDVLTVEAMHSAELVHALVALEDRPWAEISNGKPLTQSRLARLLKDFEIEPVQLKLDGKNQRGYRLEQFNTAFASYSLNTPSETATPATELIIRENLTFQTPTSDFAGSGLKSELCQQEQ